MNQKEDGVILKEKMKGGDGEKGTLKNI